MSELNSKCCMFSTLACGTSFFGVSGGLAAGTLSILADMPWSFVVLNTIGMGAIVGCSSYVAMVYCIGLGRALESSQEERKHVCSA